MKCFELWSVSLCRMARDTRPGFLRVGIRYGTSSYDRTWPLAGRSWRLSPGRVATRQRLAEYHKEGETDQDRDPDAQ